MVLLGLHHATALAGDPQRNLDYYTRKLGLRLVKRTVNFDDPGSYHLYYAVGDGSPGTLLTFFPWINSRAGAAGSGQISGVRCGAGPRPARPPADPDGVPIEFVDGGEPGLQSVTLSVKDASASGQFLRGVLGFSEVSESRLAIPGGGFVELVHAPDAPRARLAAGSVHHVAFRVADEAAQAEWREHLVARGLRVSPVKDRMYFHSIYFREPGGVLLEIATDGPGFAIDEDAGHLGEKLCLPPWLEPSRESIERRLPVLHV